MWCHDSCLCSCVWHLVFHSFHSSCCFSLGIAEHCKFSSISLVSSLFPSFRLHLHFCFCLVFLWPISGSWSCFFQSSGLDFGRFLALKPVSAVDPQEFSKGCVHKTPSHYMDTKDKINICPAVCALNIISVGFKSTFLLSKSLYFFMFLVQLQGWHWGEATPSSGSLKLQNPFQTFVN